MYLSTHFTLDELTHSQEAARSGIENTPDEATVDRLKATCYGLEEVRTLLGGKPILISSGYRCIDLNRLLGSKDTSQHVRGEAVDFTCPTFGTPAEIVRKIIASGIQYDQVIAEFGRWVHISFSDRNRKQALVIDASGTRSFA